LNGWTDDFIGAEWFEKSFIPQATARNTSGKPILLILDGHGSHETSRILQLAEIHNIIILCLPPHTTHKLQPLDVGVFGPLQRAWLERCDCVVELTGLEMRREDFINEYMQVRQGSIRPSTIISAFKKSGIWPIDRTVFIDDDYAPSIPYSTEAQDFPSLPLDPNNSDSGSESDSTDNSDAELHPSPVPSHQPLQPTSQSSSSLPATSDTAFPSSAVSSNLPHLVAPTAQPYHDPVLFDRICQLETQMQRLSGHVKMVELKLQNEKRKGNLRDGRASKRRKLNVEARVLTSAEGKRLAAEKEVEQVAKMQKKKEMEMVRKEKEAERDQ
jgi:hypothetical protein